MLTNLSGLKVCAVFNNLQCKDSEVTMLQLQQRGYEQLQAK